MNFSIIIPSYNNLQLFERAIQSVVNQEDIDFEVIVVDDSTTYEIKQYVETLQDNRIYYFHNKSLQGAVRNWNYGLSLATGKYCMLLHHDESLLDTLHLRKCLKKLSEGCDITVSNIRVHINDKINNGLCPDVLKKIALNIPVSLIALNLIGPTACIVFNRSKLQYFDENLCWLVDSEWYYRILKNKRICYLKNLYVSSLHGHDGQITFQIDIKENEKKDLRIMHKKYLTNISMRLLLLFIYIINILKKVIALWKRPI